MGLIEKMISEAIRRETGFNPRRLVRRVGGRNLLLAGGAALAGGLLASQASKQSAGAASSFGPSSPTQRPERRSPPPSAPPPPLPPLPRSGPTELPPLPGAASAPAQATAGPDDTVAAEAELPGAVRYAVTRTMVAAALADGDLAADEKALIDEQLGAGDLSDEQAAQLRRDLVVPPSVNTIASELPKGEDPELLLQFAILTARADGELSGRERTWLEGLAKALGLSAQRVEGVERSLFPGA
ncbi:MAG: DUF533 domain-containing protein [Acidobacteria bacterium]|nr:MAG: DUF533 domain-containing protein [Acidobacteriota bacterium]REK08394.1 MAG: DUF533 domain-containing protein [Acidobacteriota bacterium]